MSQIDRARRLQAIEERIELGNFYGTSPHFSVASGTNSYMTVTTGAGVYTHSYVRFVANASMLVNVYSGPTLSAPGTLLLPTNFHLAKPMNALLRVHTDPVATVLGTKLADFLIPGGSGGNSVGGAVDSGAKVILPAATVLLFEIDNLGGATANAEIIINFYEVRF